MWRHQNASTATKAHHNRFGLYYFNNEIINEKKKNNYIIM